MCTLPMFSATFPDEKMMSIWESCYDGARAFHHALAPPPIDEVARKPMSEGDRYLSLAATYTRGDN